MEEGVEDAAGLTDDSVDPVVATSVEVSVVPEAAADAGLEAESTELVVFDVVVVALLEPALPTATHDPNGPALASFLHRTRHASPFGPPVQFTLLGNIIQ